MGMFDELTCDYPMPEGFEEYQDFTFQTKDLVNALIKHRISDDGRLLRDAGKHEWVDDPSRFIIGGYLRRVTDEWTDAEYHGDIVFYPGWQHDDLPFVDFVARFTDGRLTELMAKVSHG